jgi:DNA-binding protein YbaB
MTEITATATAHHDTVSVTTYPGGGLAELKIDDHALALGPARLAETVLDLVRAATATANQKTRHALHDVLVGLPGEQVDALGLGQDEQATEQAEATVPDSWRLS